ncbi:hypothetical protein KIPE111705_46460 [Kibdelosporangium persicum]
MAGRGPVRRCGLVAGVGRPAESGPSRGASCTVGHCRAGPGAGPGRGERPVVVCHAQRGAGGRGRTGRARPGSRLGTGRSDRQGTAGPLGRDHRPARGRQPGWFQAARRGAVRRGGGRGPDRGARRRDFRPSAGARTVGRRRAESRLAPGRDRPGDRWDGCGRRTGGQVAGGERRGTPGAREQEWPRRSRRGRSRNRARPPGNRGHLRRVRRRRPGRAGPGHRRGAGALPVDRGRARGGRTRRLHDRLPDSRADGTGTAPEARGGRQPARTDTGSRPVGVRSGLLGRCGRRRGGTRQLRAGQRLPRRARAAPPSRGTARDVGGLGRLGRRRDGHRCRGRGAEPAWRTADRATAGTCRVAADPGPQRGRCRGRGHRLGAVPACLHPDSCAGAGPSRRPFGSTHDRDRGPAGERGRAAARPDGSGAPRSGGGTGTRHPGRGRGAEAVQRSGFRLADRRGTAQPAERRDRPAARREPGLRPPHARGAA